MKGQENWPMAKVNRLFVIYIWLEYDRNECMRYYLKTAEWMFHM